MPTLKKRSIVLTNVPESSEPSAFARNSTDFNRVNQVLDFLGVECRPLSVFRIGRPQLNRPRLIKVVLPSSRHQAEAVRRAPRLRFFPLRKGIFLRPSLSRVERERMRAERLSARGLQPDDRSTGTTPATQASDVLQSSSQQQSQPASNIHSGNN